jgi:hypothetical protein
LVRFDISIYNFLPVNNVSTGTPTGFLTPVYLLAITLGSILTTFQIILIPKLVGQVCLLMNDTLSASQFAHCTTTTGRAYGAFDGEIEGLSAMTGANALDVARIGIDQALLTYNVSLITDAYQRAHLELQVKNGIRIDGIRADDSFGRWRVPLCRKWKCD